MCFNQFSFLGAKLTLVEWQNVSALLASKVSAQPARLWTPHPADHSHAHVRTGTAQYGLFKFVRCS